MTLAVAFERFELIVEDLLALVQQPADERRLAVIDAAARDEAQQLLFFLLLEPRADIGADEVRLGIEWAGHLEIALLLLLLHRRAARVAIDRAALTLRRLGEQHLGNDLLDRCGLAFDRSRQR